MSGIICNITMNVDKDVHDKWLEWIRSIYVREVLETGCFERSRLLRIHAFEQGGFTYAVQFEAENMESYERYQRQFSKSISSRLEARFPGQAQTITTVLEVVDAFAGGLE